MQTGVVRWVGTWIIVVVVGGALAKTSWGQPIIYGFLWLAVLLLVLSHSEELNSFFSQEALRLNG